MDLTCLQVYNFSNKIRLGKQNDGGYVIGDLNGKYDAYFSCGVSNEESFTEDFLNNYDISKSNCFAFDGTINDYPYQYTTSINFIKKNIGYFNNNKTTNLLEHIQPYENIFLKMDIDGGEYSWFTALTEDDLNKFKQITMEMHGINDDDYDIPFFIKVNILKLLNKTHYIIHAHGNNHRGEVNGVPDVIELTFVRKDYFSEIPLLNFDPLPSPTLDFPNSRCRPDLDLNFYPFVNK